MVSSLIVCFDSVTIAGTILILIIVDSSIIILFCHVTLFLSMLVLAPRAEFTTPLPLIDSMKFIFMPFSKFSKVIKPYYSHSLFLTLRIQIASVPSMSSLFFPTNICEPVLDGLKFRLEQPFKPFIICNLEKSFWQHLESVVNLRCFLAFSLHYLFKTLMGGSWCLVVMSEVNESLEFAMGVIEHILDHNIVFLKHIPHLSWARMQELTDKGNIIERIAKNVNDYIYILDLSKLVYRPCKYCLLHFYFLNIILNLKFL